MRSIAVDTGAIVSLLRPADALHGVTREAFAGLRPNDLLATTWPVLTECAFILRRQADLFWDWLETSGIQVLDFKMSDLREMRSWARRYQDREVDFADASLIWLATHLKTNLVMTTDFRDFETYRLPNGKPLHLLIKRM